MEKSREQRIDEYVKSEQKSSIVAFGLAFLLGPIGYLYTSVVGGVIAILTAIVLGGVFWPLALVIWILCIIAAPFEVASKNKKIRAKAELIAG